MNTAVRVSLEVSFNLRAVQCIVCTPNNCFPNRLCCADVKIDKECVFNIASEIIVLRRVPITILECNRMETINATLSRNESFAKKAEKKRRYEFEKNV